MRLLGDFNVQIGLIGNRGGSIHETQAEQNRDSTKVLRTQRAKTQVVLGDLGEFKVILSFSKHRDNVSSVKRTHKVSLFCRRRVQVEEVG